MAAAREATHGDAPEVIAAVLGSPAAARALAAALQEGVVLQDAEGTVLAATAAARRLLGSLLPGDGVAGPSGPGWPAIDAEGQPCSGPSHPTARCLATGEAQHDHVLGVQDGRRTRWLNVTATPVGAPDEAGIRAVLTTMVEVTDPHQPVAPAADRIPAAQDVADRAVHADADHPGADHPDAAHPDADHPDADRATTAIPGRATAGATDAAAAGARGAPDPMPGQPAPDLARDALRQAEERFRLAFDMAPTGNAIVLPDGRFIRVNAQLASMLGSNEVDLLGSALGDLVRPEDTARMQALLEGALGASVPSKAELRLCHVTGRPVHAAVTVAMVHDGDGQPTYLIAQVEDITARKLAQAALTHQATHDPLTALPNRTLLLDRLGQALERSRRNGTHVALLFCDVDRFKRINDSLGHEAGDQLLVEVAQRLRTCIRGSDTAGRLSGDEFLVICEELARPEDALVLAERVKAITDEAIALGDQLITVSLSIGVAHASAGDKPAILLRRADTAMYEAKERGRGRFEVFDEALRDRALTRLQLESELRLAVTGQQLRLYHQPIVDLGRGTIVGQEALIRWQHPERGLLAPGAFLDVAEESDLIVELGSWVLEEACHQGQLMSLGLPGAHMAINVSARQLGRPDFRARVEAALARSGLRHRQLILELTETSLLKASSTTLADVEALSRDGVRLAVDDFGTGYSSLTYLQRLPVAVVKIDRSFVADITTDAKRRAIAKAVISLGQALDLEVVAEGVETADQAALLADMGCLLAQGYLFGRPAPLGESPPASPVRLPPALATAVDAGGESASATRPG